MTLFRLMNPEIVEEKMKMIEGKLNDGRKTRDREVSHEMGRRNEITLFKF
jgi:hypothetical protein